MILYLSCGLAVQQAGVSPHVVAARLGHSVTMLFEVYAHALPSGQQQAAQALGALLHGR